MSSLLSSHREWGLAKFVNLLLSCLVQFCAPLVSLRERQVFLLLVLILLLLLLLKEASGHFAASLPSLSTGTKIGHGKLRHTSSLTWVYGKGGSGSRGNSWLSLPRGRQTPRKVSPWSWWPASMLLETNESTRWIRRGHHKSLVKSSTMASPGAREARRG